MNKAPFLWIYATPLAGEIPGSGSATADSHYLKGHTVCLCVNSVKADDEIKEKKVVVKKEEIDSSCRNGTEEPSTSLHGQEEEKVLTSVLPVITHADCDQ